MVDIERRRRRSIPGAIPSNRRAVERPSPGTAPVAAPITEPLIPPETAAAAPAIEAPRRVHFAPPPVDPESAAGVAARILLASLGESVQHQVERVLEGEELPDLHPLADRTEATHDLRVAARRARSLLGPVRGVFTRAEIERLRGGLRWIGKLTGPSRDLELLLERFRANGEDLPEEDRRAIDSLIDFVGRDREQAGRALAKGLRSKRLTRLLEVWAAIAKAPTERPAAAQPIGKVAAEAIDRAWRRLIKHGHAIDNDSPPETLHQVRIDGKKLRYLLELFRSAYPEVDLGDTIVALKKLQDCLGDLNDSRVQEEALRHLAPRLQQDAAGAAASLVLVGRLIERSVKAQASARRRFQNRFTALDSKEHRRRIRSLAA